ncbi:MAG: acetyl/propionyl/methylcrotonyl-CoA carboxylase subunit alpha [Hoeflea sp.]|uniref:acetyl/propionyl/methylcrotonyl-CoA carboxylase subunit alpha n=1 Tax=Hoeflea sp. TaxID=1940281 RepID=UPI001E0784CA|nr:acetyl/propionyl/methylcrotonyl-CoA carboxylase subunit alpha [Hoeflea sp.]MBU4531028.1 acetyl/propionyl/methylcrotonyl-CoA carboxylase subunit alpha [Alphaproteobacteria bacterium]MBU4542803.1 acetyl/propionyl/methylcrotonyl-CoA carboxylase subunit alpha [Alphaproteobacteria bacterium]MBU4552615.1 acetyl/propionyl/methylcrotonyl-CoA carboxylase subunit alpha [Alphaproteobacteria bacterium]MBV1722920.1 acetyl/propionyl/methylcrotonyl-CoA carboxylase subunit alpha [Hoeflea sp.]MBV1762831.1 a
MITKILIANRGEIACRVIRTARMMGIATVAVYSEADRNALHVEMADEAVLIGPAQASESYLKVDAILDAAKRTGADAIHPGYGFLSENPDFVEKVERAGLIFIGPSAKAIRAMGLKDAAKALMEKANVPVVPGYHGEAQELVVLAGKANEIGFPVLIKARAGGGGKGMRKVDNQADFPAALSSARREAKASFGDDRVLVEKYVTTPRHIEIQVFGDSHGNVVHLFERDCSAQRRHQKVIEEAPAPGMPAEMRAAMGAAAVQAAKAISYCGAGTVEFIVDASEGLNPDRFWFMEMNTRLQVEHPVTELITGLDLVEWQIRVASGEALPMRQEELAINGHAVEARIYAEDAGKGFLPAVGRLAHLAFPNGDIRVDAGVREGDEITPFYDPMIAKVIAHGKTRAEALSKLAGALGRTEIAGTVTNTAFLAKLCRDADFAAGRLDTGLIERNLASLTEAEPAPDHIVALAALAASGMVPAPGGGAVSAIGPFEIWGAPRRRVVLEIDGAEHAFQVERLGADHWRVSGAGLAVDMDLEAVSARGHDWAFRADGVARRCRVAQSERSVAVFYEGLTHLLSKPQGKRSDDLAAGGDQVISAMPGIVKHVLVEAGASVKSGDAMVIMEAMKMEMTLSAPRDGVVAEVLVAVGAQVTDGVSLVTLQVEAEAA